MGTLLRRAAASLRPAHRFVAEPLEQRTLLSLELVKDINTDTVGSNPSGFTESGGLLYFVADDGAHGVELWKTDGTVAGTSLVEDIDPRPVHRVLRWTSPDSLPPLIVEQGDSHPTALADLDGTLLFYADDGAHGGELWKSDGTAAGTVMVKDINPGPASSADVRNLGGERSYDVVSLAALGGAVYFVARDDSAGSALWRSDGTEAGTVPVKRFPDMIQDRPSRLFVSDGRLYFNAFDPASGWEPWVSDGTAEGTVLLTDAWAGPSSSDPWQFTSAGGSVYFTGASGPMVYIPGVFGLWKTDGTPAGTRRVTAGHSAVYMGSTGPRLYVGTAPVAAEGGTLWKIDPDDVGLVRVRDFPGWGMGSLGNSPAGFTRLSDTTVFFSVNDHAVGVEPWRSDGTAAGTTLLADLLPGPSPSAPGSRVSLDGTIYFAAGLTHQARELFKTDGTTGGTVRVKDVFPGPGSSDPYWLTAYRGRVWFSARTAHIPYPGERELWVTDGTDAGTVLFKDVNTDNGGGASGLLKSSRGTFFVGNGGDTGLEPWITDGTEAGTRLLKDIAPGATDSRPYFLTLVGDTLFFLAYGPGVGLGLWKSDGTPQGTLPVRPIATRLELSEGPGVSFTNSFDLSGTLLFYGSEAEHGFELWRSDGTDAGTTLVKDIQPGPKASRVEFLSLAGDSVLMWADDGVHGRELWKTDGTAGGTVLVKDVSPGARSARDGFNTPGSVIVGGVVYFAADDGATGPELWRSDGTAAGTWRVADVVPGATGASPANLVVLDGVIYFIGRDGQGGTAFYRSDGTEAGTAKVPIDFGGRVWLSHLAAVGGGLYFTAVAPNPVFLPPTVYGLTRGEVYRSDGTAAGTVRLAENVTGSNWTALGDKVYFADYAGEDFTLPPFNTGAGSELWVTDGTPVGTRLVADLMPGPAGSGPASLVSDGSTLLFTASDGRHGYEIWRYTPEEVPRVETRVTDRRLFYNNSAFDRHDSDPTQDLGAVANDKRALLPVQGPAGFENLSSYTKGINGLLVQFFSRGPLPGELGPDDFEFRIGTAGDPADWPLAPPPTSVAVIPVPGPGRLYSITWPDGAVRNTWLRVTVKANGRTGLAEPDVFYFGNLVGETGDGDARTRAMPRVTAIDLAAIRRAINTPADKTSAEDMNRDGRVNALDLAAVRSNYNRNLSPFSAATGRALPPVTGSLLQSLLEEDVASATGSLLGEIAR